MKKLFTLAAAVLASLAMMADVTYSFIKSDGSLNTTDFQGGLTPKADGNQTFESVAYTNYAAFGGTTGAPNYAANKTLVYNCKTSATALKIYAYNGDSGSKLVYITTFDEAANAFVNETISIDKQKQQVIEKSYTNTTNKTIYIHTSSTKMQFYKIDVTESGEALKQAGEIGYSFNFNKSRACLASSTTAEYNIDGMKIVGVSSNHTPNSSTELQIKSTVTDNVITSLAYVEFTAPAACRLHVKDNNGKGYWVSQTLAAGVDEDLVISGDATMEITAGKWYIISSNKGAIKFNKIEFLAPDLTPSLSVNPDTISLAADIITPNPSTSVKFTGKNLTAGNYDLVLPSSMIYWTISPQSVTVGEDGKLDATITIAYEGNDIIEEESSSISLTIDGITKTVGIHASSNMNMEKNYITGSVDIEGSILAQGKSFGTVAALTAANIEIAEVNGNDSLNNNKGAMRNEAYLGLKLNQTTNAYVGGWVQAGDVLRVKFGNIPTAVTVTLNGEAAADHTSGVYEFSAIEDTYVKLAPKGTGSKLVLKQVSLNEPIVDAMYAINYAATTNGTVTGWQIAIPGETVTLTVTPAEGYKVASVTLNSEALVPVEDVYSFTMPAAAAYVAATFTENTTTALDNTDAAVKAVKRIENGMLIINMNGTDYNVLGQTIR